MTDNQPMYVSQIDWFSLGRMRDIGDIQGEGGWHPSQK